MARIGGCRLVEALKQPRHQLGEWLEQHGERDPMVLAGHFERGGQGERAATYYLRATEQALLIRDLPATMARVGLGLGCAPPEAIRIRLLGLRCDAASTSLRMIGDVMADAEELLRAAPRGSVPWLQAMLAYLQGMLVTRRIDDFMAALESLRAVEPAPTPWARSRSRTSLACSRSTTSGRSRRRRRSWSGSRRPSCRVQSASGSPGTGGTSRWACGRSMPTKTRGAPFSTQTRSRRSAPRSGAVGCIPSPSSWCAGSAAGASERPRWPSASSRGSRSADASLGIGSSLRRFALAWLRADRGAVSEARALAAQLCEDGRAHHNALEESRGRWVLAEVLRRAGDLDAVDRELQIALAMAVPLEQPGIRATLAALRLAQRRPEDALAAAEDALARATAMGGCGLFRGAFVRLARAEALHATGDLDAASRAIAGARARLIAIADTIAEPAYRTSFLGAVPENARTFALARAWQGEPEPGT